MTDPFDGDDPLDALLRDGGAEYLAASDGLAGDLDDVRNRSHRQTIAFRTTAASITALIVLVGVIGLSRGRTAAPPTQFDSASPAAPAPSTSTSTTSSVPAPAPLPTPAPGPTATSRVPAPTTSLPDVQDASTTTSATTEEPPPSTELPPETTVPTTVLPSPPVAAGVAGLQLRGDGLGSLPFGSDAETAVFTLTAAFGTPSADTGWNGPTRTVTWGPLRARFVDNGGRSFTGWSYGANGAGASAPKLQTSTGITLSTPGREFNAREKPTSNQGGALCFDAEGTVCAAFAPPVASGLAADPVAVVVSLSAGAG